MPKLKTYEVLLTTDQTASATVTVRAASKQAAFEAAKERAKAGEFIFETNDNPSWDFYLGSGLEEDVEEMEPEQPQ